MLAVVMFCASFSASYPARDLRVFLRIPGFFLFPQRAAARLFPCARLMLAFQVLSLLLNAYAIHFPSEISVPGLPGALAPSVLSSLATRPSTASSSGSAPDVQLSISSNRYAPVLVSGGHRGRRVSARWSAGETASIMGGGAQDSPSAAFGNSRLARSRLPSHSKPSAEGFLPM